MTLKTTCAVCQAIFVKKKCTQLYCSRACYGISWSRRNPEKHRARSRQRRQDHPEWYREREPKYYRTYRAKMLSSRPWRYLLQSARLRAKEKQWAYELDDTWARRRWTGKCEITSIPFEQNGSRGPWPLSPTIDRINSKKGYTKRNSRFVLWGCNAIKGSGTDADMLKIAKAIVNNLQ